jgi:hypothetical protein
MITLASHVGERYLDLRIYISDCGLFYCHDLDLSLA